MIKSPHKSPFRGMTNGRNRLQLTIALLGLVGFIGVIFTALHLSTTHEPQSGLVKSGNEAQHKVTVLSQRLRKVGSEDSTATGSLVRGKIDTKDSGSRGIVEARDLPLPPHLGEADTLSSSGGTADEQQQKHDEGNVVQGRDPVVEEHHEGNDGHISHYKGKPYDTHHESAPVKMQDHHDSHNYGYGGGDSKSEDASPEIGVKKTLSSVHISGAAGAGGIASFPNLKQYGAIGVKSHTSGGGEWLRTSEKEEDVDPVKLYHRALRTGSVCQSFPHINALTAYQVPQQPGSSYPSAEASKSMLESLEDRLFQGLSLSIAHNRHKAFIQFLASPTSGDWLARNTLAGAVAMAFPALTSVLIRMPAVFPASSTLRGAPGPGHGGYTGALEGNCGKTAEVSNLFVATSGHHHGSGSSSSSSSSSGGGGGERFGEGEKQNGGIDVDGEGIYDCVQVVLEQELLLLVGSRLPFEYEEALSRILCRCSETILPLSLPVPPADIGSATVASGDGLTDDLEQDAHRGGASAAGIAVNPNYFLNWEDMNALVAGAAKSLDTCSFQVVPTLTGGSGRSTSKGSEEGGKEAYLRRLRYSFTIVERVRPSTPGSPSSSSSSFSSRSSGAAEVARHSTRSGFLSVQALLSLPLSDTSAQAVLASMYEYSDVAALLSPSAPSASSSRGLVITGSEVRSELDGYKIGNAEHDAARRRAALQALQSKHDGGVRVGVGVGLADRSRRRLRSQYLDGLVSQSVSSSTMYRNSSLSSSSSTTSSTSSLMDTPELQTRPLADKEGISRPAMRSVLSSSWSLPEGLVTPAAGMVRALLGAGASEYWTTVWAEWLSRTEPFIGPVGGEGEEEVVQKEKSLPESSGDSKTARLPSGSGGSGYWQGADGGPSVVGGTGYRTVTGGVSSSSSTTATNKAAAAAAAAFAGSSDVGGMDADLRAQQKLLYLREELLYRKWLLALKHNQILRADGGGGSGGGARAVYESTVVMMWGRHVSLLSSKLANAMARHARLHSAKASDKVPMLVSMLTDQHSVSAHRASNELLGVSNNLVASSRVTVAQMGALLAAPDRAGVGIFQIDVFLRLLALSALGARSQAGACEATGALMEELLAALLHSCERCLLELPTSARLQTTLSYLLPSSSDPACVDTLMQKYSHGAPQASSSSLGAVMGLLDKAAQRLLRPGASASIEEKPWSAGGDSEGNVLVEVTIPEVATGATASDKGMSLYTLLHLGVEASTRRKLLQLTVDMPLWALPPSSAALVKPWNLYVHVTRVREHQGSSGAGARDATSSDESLSMTLYPRSTSQVGTGDSGGGSLGAATVGTSLGLNHFQLARSKAMLLFETIAAELEQNQYETAEGLFSFLEHGSNYGYFSSMLARRYPNATIISLERDARQVRHHLRMLRETGVNNNAVCLKREPDAIILRNLAESPELLRFQLLASGFEDAFTVEDSVEEWGRHMGDLLSSAVTTFLYVPPSRQVSLAMEVIFSVSDLLSSAGDRVPPSASQGHGEADEGVSLRSSWGPRRSLEAVLTDPSAEGHDPRLDLASHPLPYFATFDTRWLLQHTQARDGHTGVSVSPLHRHGGSSTDSMALPFVRCDIVNMTRNVHHHYDYRKDGHARTYTMRIVVNDTLSSMVSAEPQLGLQGRGYGGLQSKQSHEGIMLTSKSHRQPPPLSLPSNASIAASESSGSDGGLLRKSEDGYTWTVLPRGAHPSQGRIIQVHLMRNKDSFPIPYTAIRGVTLISTLRLGLVTSQRDALFKSFLRLPLYEDMAPWNVILSGNTLDYIDYDTMGVVFDSDIPKAYRVMAVLMNYKRTVEDFRRCEQAAKNDYGIHFVSDCVGSKAFSTFGGSSGNFLSDKKTVSCHSMEAPVPCADGKCHSDYISCLRSLSDVAEEISQEAPSALLANQAASSGDHTAATRHVGLWSDTSLVSAMKKGAVFDFNS